MRSNNGALTPQGTPSGDSITKMSIDNNCRSGSFDLSMDSECDRSIITNKIINKTKSKKINNNYKYKMSQQNYFISFVVNILFLIVLTTNNFVLCDDIASGSGYSDVTTTEFNPIGRGNKKFSDRCNITNDCGFAGSICDPKMKVCTCDKDVSATNHIDKCGRPANVNETCFFSEQCEATTPETECRDSRCICRFDKIPITKKDGSVECTAVKNEPVEPIRTVDPAMIGVLVGMALMFVIICVVLRLFSQARWRENRTIFNTPNPRLMNVSLLRDNKLLHGGERRGSRMSVRVPSRQPSMASLRPHSPNASIGSRRGSRGSGTSLRSNRSLNHHHSNHRDSNGHPNHTTNLSHQPLLSHQQNGHQQQNVHVPPVHVNQPPHLESVKVEITEVKP